MSCFALVFSGTNSSVLVYKLLPEVGRCQAAPLPPLPANTYPSPLGLVLNKLPSCIVFLYSRAASIRSRRRSCRRNIPALQRYFCPQRQAPEGSSGQECVRTHRLSNAALFTSGDEAALAREAAASQPPRQDQEKPVHPGGTGLPGEGAAPECDPRRYRRGRL